MLASPVNSSRRHTISAPATQAPEEASAPAIEAWSAGINAEENSSTTSMSPNSGTKRSQINLEAPHAPLRSLLRVKLPPTACDGTILDVYDPTNPSSSSESLFIRAPLRGGPKHVQIQDVGDTQAPPTAGTTSPTVEPSPPTSPRYQHSSNTRQRKPRRRAVSFGSDTVCKTFKDSPSKAEMSELDTPIQSLEIPALGGNIPEQTPEWMMLGKNYRGFCHLVPSAVPAEWKSISVVPRLDYTSTAPADFFEQFIKRRRPCILFVPPESLRRVSPTAERSDDSTLANNSPEYSWPAKTLPSHNESFESSPEGGAAATKRQPFVPAKSRKKKRASPVNSVDHDDAAKEADPPVTNDETTSGEESDGDLDNQHSSCSVEGRVPGNSGDTESPESDCDLFKILTSWSSFAYLKEKAGDCEVDVEIRGTESQDPNASFGLGNRTKMTFGDFLDGIRAGNETYYLTTQPIPENHDGPVYTTSPLLQNELHPDFPDVPKLVPTLIPAQHNLWIGNSTNGSSSGLHHDYHDSLYVLIRGKKKFRIFSPRCAEASGTVGRPVTIFGNGLISYDTGRREDGASLTSVLAWKIRQEKTGLQALRTRLATVDVQVSSLQSMLDRDGVKTKVTKTRRKRKARFRNEPSCRDLQKQLCKVKNLRPAHIASQLNSKLESKRLVEQYISDAEHRVNELRETLDELLLQVAIARYPAAAPDTSLEESGDAASRCESNENENIEISHGASERHNFEGKLLKTNKANKGRSQSESLENKVVTHNKSVLREEAAVEDVPAVRRHSHDPKGSCKGSEWAELDAPGQPNSLSSLNALEKQMSPADLKRVAKARKKALRQVQERSGDIDPCGVDSAPEGTIKVSADSCSSAQNHSSADDVARLTCDAEVSEGGMDLDESPFESTDDDAMDSDWGFLRPHDPVTIPAGQKPPHFCERNTVAAAESNEFFNVLPAGRLPANRCVISNPKSATGTPSPRKKLRSNKTSSVTSTPPRRLESSSQSPNPETNALSVQDQLLRQYLEISLNPGEILYLPASWFHEVISYSNDGVDSDCLLTDENTKRPAGGEGVTTPPLEVNYESNNLGESTKGHIAFNFWFFPPSTSSEQCFFQTPYPDSFWEQRYRRICEINQLNALWRELNALRASGVVQSKQLLQLLMLNHPEMAQLPQLRAAAAADDNDDDTSTTQPLSESGLLASLESSPISCETTEEPSTTSHCSTDRSTHDVHSTAVVSSPSSTTTGRASKRRRESAANGNSSDGGSPSSPGMRIKHRRRNTQQESLEAGALEDSPSRFTGVESSPETTVGRTNEIFRTSCTDGVVHHSRGSWAKKDNDTTSSKPVAARARDEHPRSISARPTAVVTSLRPDSRHLEGGASGLPASTSKHTG